jgi:hypothetical protein
MMNVRVFAGIMLFMSIATAWAVDAPELQEGLWEVRGYNLENPGQKKTEFAAKICRDHEYDKKSRIFLEKTKGCTLNITSLGGARYSSKSHCTINGTVVDSTSTIEFQSATAVHSESHTTYSPAFRGKQEDTIVQDQKYAGVCPSGMKPGESRSQQVPE